MKMNNILKMMLAASFIFGLTACSSGGDVKSDSGEVPAQEEATKQEESNTETEKVKQTIYSMRIVQTKSYQLDKYTIYGEADGEDKPFTSLWLLSTVKTPYSGEQLNQKMEEIRNKLKAQGLPEDSYEVKCNEEKGIVNLTLTLTPEIVHIYNHNMSATSTPVEIYEIMSNDKDFKNAPEKGRFGILEDRAKEERAAQAETPTEAPASGIRPEFQEAMDSYRAFFDEYAAFMTEYANNPSDLTLLTKYASFLDQYSETMEKLDAMDTKDMTDEELKLYLDTTNYASKVMIDASSAIGN